MNNDAFKNNEGDTRNETWTNLLREFQFFENMDDHIMYLRRRFVLGAAEWMAGQNGSKQNDKLLFEYTDSQWEYIWMTMLDDGAWAVPGIKDDLGNTVKANDAPEILIKFIAHELKCHIIVFDLVLNRIQFLSGNHVKSGNVVFDSPLLIYSTGGHFQSVFQTDHEYFVKYAKQLDSENDGFESPSNSSNSLNAESRENQSKETDLDQIKLHSEPTEKSRKSNKEIDSTIEHIKSIKAKFRTDEQKRMLNAFNQREKRLKETDEMKKARKDNDKARQILIREKETEKICSTRKEKNKIQMKIARENETEEMTEARQEKNKIQMKTARENETEDMTKVRKEKDKNQKKTAQENETEDNRRKRLDKIKQNMKKIRSNSSELKRLKKFREAVRYGPIFTCTVCEQDMFRNSVTVLNDELEEKLRSKSPELGERVFLGKHRVEINEVSNFYICGTCKKEIKKGNLPSMAAANGLDVVTIDKDLELTELENNLIAKRILFQKIFQLPKSRMAACKDRLINIPINSEVVQNTLENIPRTPREAGLLEVKLKRKLEYKNTHQQAFIDCEKIYKALDFLKKMGHPDYAFYDDCNIYERRCNKSTEPIFVHDCEIEEIVEKAEYLEIRNKEEFKEKTKDFEGPSEMTDGEESEEEDSDNEEEEYQKNDVVRKFQFDYNKSVCLVDKFPEAAVTDEPNIDNEQLSFAPGEGKSPESILTSKNWDAEAFPMKHPDGGNGLHQKRERKLTDQYYFVQRMRNTDTRFSTDPAYVFAAAAYLEKKQLQRNVNVSYQRGKQVKAANGVSTFHLEDGYSVFGNIKNTPKYWKTAKYEMLAKLDNLGPFHFFFTLSCADLRWDENFSSILRKLGITVEYEARDDGTDTY